MAVFWLVILIGAANAPLHVGNFPDLATCQNAGNELALSGAGSGTAIGAAPYVSYVCVRTNTGKASDPGPPG